MFDDPDKKLRWMEQELLAAEANEDAEAEIEEEFDPELLEELDLTPEDLRPDYNYAVDFARTIYADEDTWEVEADAPPVKKKGIKGLLLLAGLELLGIMLILGWWLQWLI